MAGAKVKHDWAQTSSVMALIANCHRDPRKCSAFKPSDFDPTAGSGEQSRVADKEDLAMLRDVFKRKEAPRCLQPR